MKTHHKPAKVSGQRRISAADPRRPASPEDAHERKRRVLTKGVPSVVRSIADAVVAKDGNLFFLSEPDGAVPIGGEHGFGLYFHDCRFLNGYELKVAGVKPDVLLATATRGFMAVLQLANPDIRREGRLLIPKERIGIRWERMVESNKPALEEVITFQNFGLEAVELPLSLSFGAAFESIFAVRGLLEERPGKLRPPAWRAGVLSFRYHGADGVCRGLAIHFSPPPDSARGTTAHFKIGLQPRESRQIKVSLVIAESPDPGEVEPKAHARRDIATSASFLERSAGEWLAGKTEIRSDSILLNQIISRSLLDLGMLRSDIAGRAFFAAGVPWFATLFGRDSIITALQTLAYDPAIAEQTLRVLAGLQGDRVDEWRDEQPGKIMHEYRLDELSRMGDIPYHPPYYGTVDATPLFLILIGQHAAWTGSLALFNELRGNVERALEWLAKYGDADGDGYIEYHSAAAKGLINQGWKDSGDAIVNADGSLAETPIALVEVQGYAYLAKVTLADLYRRAGDQGRADRLRKEAARLRRQFNRDFWLDEEQYYALALQAGGRPAAVISSNPGQALWTGIVDAEKARHVVERLMADDMFGGWGVRTLSSQERRYNPVGYHLGTIWPHDNAIIAAGCRRYGCDDAARRIFRGIVEAAMRYEYFRLPELFAGFARGVYEVPVHYPVACRPQAWAAGTMPFLVQTMLGLAPEALDGRLRIVRPMLPSFADRLEVRGLRVGDARIDLRFSRGAEKVAVEVLSIDGRLEVVVEDGVETP